MDQPSTRHTIDLPAGPIAYREAGPTDGPPVVFVHGFLVDETVWGEVPQRLAEQGLRTFAPTWPLGAHTRPMKPDADLSPRGQARIVLSFLAALDLRDVTLVGNDTGGAVCQFLLDEDASRIGRVVLTNCDAFDTFPPVPFNLLFRLCRHPRAARAALQATRWAAFRNSRLGFGWLVRRPLTAAESRGWVIPYLTDARIRRDVAGFARGWRPADLADVGTRLPAVDRPVLLCWGAADRFFTGTLAHRLRQALRQSSLVEIAGARTFVALDRPDRLAEEVRAFVPLRQ